MRRRRRRRCRRSREGGSGGRNCRGLAMWICCHQENIDVRVEAVLGAARKEGGCGSKGHAGRQRRKQSNQCWRCEFESRL